MLKQGKRDLQSQKLKLNKLQLKKQPEQQKNAFESKKLLELAEKEKKAKIAEDKKKAEELAKLSAANRVEYEK